MPSASVDNVADIPVEWRTPAKKSAKTRLLFLIKLAISGSLIYYLLGRANLAEIWQAVENSNVTLVIASFLLHGIGYYASSYRWHLLLRDQGFDVPVGYLVRSYAIAMFFNNLLPSTIGGDGYRFLIIRADHPGKSEQTFSSILLERGFGYLILIVVNILLAAWFWKFLSSQTWLLLIEIGLAAGLVFIGILWLFRYRFAAILPKWKFLSKLEQFLHMIDIQDRRVLFISVGTSFLFVLIGGVWLGVYYWSVGVQVDWLYTIYVSTLMNIIGAIPITLNGLGIVELVQVRMMGLVGIPIETVLVVSIMTRMVLILLSLPGGILSFR